MGQQFLKLVQYWPRTLQPAAVMWSNGVIAPRQCMSTKSACFCHWEAQIVIISVTTLWKGPHREIKRFYLPFAWSSLFVIVSNQVSLKEKSCSEVLQQLSCCRNQLNIQSWRSWREECWEEFVVLEYRKQSLVLSKRFSKSWLNI